MRVHESVKQILVAIPLLALPILAASAELPPELAADRLVLRAERQAREGEHRAALASLDEAQALFAEHGLEAPPDFWFRHAQVARAVGEHERAMESATRYAALAGREGEHYLAALEILDAVEWELEALRKAQAEARVRRERDEAAARAARERLAMAFADALLSGGRGPLMVPIPAGTFRMGCLSYKGGPCPDDEKPVHVVRIAEPFALSVYEVTFDEWDACVAVGGCGGHRPDDEGWGRGNRPVINVSWRQAWSYVAWLSAETGQSYRLPSESEWEYAARAGSTTVYSWGDEIGTNRTNCREAVCGDRWQYTAPVGSFRPNAFGLYDMHGNVWEWVEDCWNDSYEGAPTDGSAWKVAKCERHVVRSGMWDGWDPYFGRSAMRQGHLSESQGHQFVDYLHGFRVARTLAP